MVGHGGGESRVGQQRRGLFNAKILTDVATDTKPDS